MARVDPAAAVAGLPVDTSGGGKQKECKAVHRHPWPATGNKTNETHGKFALRCPMNRDRSIAVVLALILLVSLVGNWVLWRKSRVVGPATIAKPEGRQGVSTRERGVPAVFEIVANPEMKGRLGRVVIAYADGVTINPDANRTGIYKEGEDKEATYGYGPVARELAPGTYDLVINGKKVSGIPIKSGSDTRIPSGVLRLHGANELRFTIHDVGKESSFKVAYGNALVGLPAGDYEIEVNGSREKFTIEPGKITDF